MLFYSLWQFIAAWLVQTDEVRKSLVNRIDFFITGVIAILSIIYYLHKTGVYVLEIALDIPTLVKFLSFSIGTFLGFIGILHGVEKIREKLDKAIKKIEMEIETLLIENEWELTYNEKTGQYKKIKFLANGNIGAGKNNNETTWRVREGLLEILNLQGNIYSRFRYDQDNNVFNHTNDLDTLSKRNQIIRPFRMVA
ncbi:MAG: hypothetical protein EA357_01725 [Micavibrio sp.]|nr:MAG: hypothetical protein EA357_01725 [Micavibrio sp.]